MSASRRTLVKGALAALSRGAFLGVFTPAGAKAFFEEPAEDASSRPEWDETVDVLIVGSGGAGTASALSAAEAGAGRILVIEKNALIGGNTRYSSGYFNAVDPERQSAQGIEDSVEKHIAQTIAAGRGRGKPELVAVLCRQALPTLKWLEGYGVEWEKECIIVYGGTFPRGHVPTAQSLQKTLVDGLFDQCLKMGVRLWTRTSMTGLVRQFDAEGRAGEILGAVVRTAEGAEKKIRARKAVVLAAGGYAANAALCALHDPRLADLPTTNIPGATGEVMLAAKAAGAFLTGCDFIECIPLQVEYSRLSLFVDRCIFVNRQGRRFIREDATRDVFRDRILALPRKEAYVIVDDRGFKSHPLIFQKRAIEGINKGQVYSAPTLEILAQQIRVPASALAESVRSFNEAVERRRDTEFGRSPESLIHKIEKPPFWASDAHLSIHHTMGGVAINERAQVLDWDGRVIPRLYAAGEVTGGIHGASRVGGNAITDVYVFGRIAGRGAASEPAGPEESA